MCFFKQFIATNQSLKFMEYIFKLAFVNIMFIIDQKLSAS